MASVIPVLNPKDRRAEALGDEITELYGLITAATYELLVKIRHFDQERLWEQPGLCSCAQWLNWKCGIGMNAGREKVRVARALGELPAVSEAFRRGEVSYSKVRAITRVATPENEEYLLQIARHGTAHHVETVVRGYRRACRLNDLELAEAQHEQRRFEYHWDENGSLVFNGRLPAEVGALLMKALQSAVDARNPHADVTAETSATRHCEEPSDHRHCEERSDEAISTKRADALAEMAESYLASGPAQSSAADRYQVMIHVTAETSATRHGERSDAISRIIGTSHIEHGPHVTAETSRRLCCDTSITRLVEDDKGNPLSIGRKSRVIPPAMRRALNARDRGCRFPGCTHTAFVDGHHIRHWAGGGETGLDNLVQLCRRHHRLVHEGGFRCEKDGAGRIVFRDRSGQRIGNAPVPISRYRGNVIAHLREQLEDRHFDAQTCVTHWDGERMDRNLAVDLLWDISHSPFREAGL